MATNTRYTLKISNAGSAASPSLYFSTDTTTGLYRPSANQIAFAVSGTNIMTYTGSAATLSSAMSLVLSNTTASTSSSTGALQVAGGAYLGAASLFNANITFRGGGSTDDFNGTFFSYPADTVFSGSNNYYYNVFSTPFATGGTTGSAYTVYIAGAPVGASLAYSLYINGGVSRFADTTASTSSATGAVRITGGLGISGTTDATSSTNGGTFTTAGGMAVAKKLFVGTALYLANGSAGTPSYSFTNDTATGMYLAAAGSLVLFTAGAEGTMSVLAATITMGTGTLSTITSTWFNDGTNANSSAQFKIQTEATGGDPYMSLVVNATSGWSIGLDNSDSDKFKISSGSAPVPGTNDRFVMTSTGDVSLSSTSASSSSTTGAFQCAGGGYFGANSLFGTGATVTISNTTAATSATVGALTVAGGIGIAKQLCMGSQISDKIVVMYETGSATAFYGFGIASGILKYNVDLSTSSHVFYYASTNELFRIHGSGQTRAQNGSASIPSYSFVNSTTTGIYRSAADTIGWTTSSTLRMTLSTTALNLQSGTLLTSADTTNSTSTATGSVQLSGGIGVVKDGYFGASNSGNTNKLTLANESNTASSVAQFDVRVGGATAGNPFASFVVSSVSGWAVGLDNATSDRFNISYSSAGTPTLIDTVSTTTANSTGRKFTVRTDGEVEVRFDNTVGGAYRGYADRSAYGDLTYGISTLSTTATASDGTFSFFTCWSDSLTNRQFRVGGAGGVFAVGTFTTQAGADVAWYMESASGAELPVGETVVLAGAKIRIATLDDDPEDILGVIRSKDGGVSFVSNAAWSAWQGKYLVDDFDGHIYEDYEIYEWDSPEGKKTCLSYEADGVAIPADRIVITHDPRGQRLRRFAPNPAYTDAPYVPRHERPEWHIIGLVGIVKIRKTAPKHPSWKLLTVGSGLSDTYLLK